MWCWHDWEKWGEPKLVTMTRFFPQVGEQYDYNIKIQTRKCKRCGKVEETKIG